jgi:hypothetical protein
VTESLVGAGIAPSIHQGHGIIVSALSKSTVRATIETSDDEEDFSFEIVKEELWRAVRLLEEHGCGSEVPSARPDKSRQQSSPHEDGWHVSDD